MYIACYFILQYRRMQNDPGRLLEYQWISSLGIEMGSCKLIHEGPCSIEFLRKVMVVCKIGLKYYLPFHLIPLFLRLLKTKSTKQAGEAAMRRLFYYTKSVLFMGILVGVTKGALCFCSSTMPIRMNGWVLVVNSLFAPLGIFLEESSRRRQIGYFVMAKAMRSIYVILKRRSGFSFAFEEQLMHMLLMAGFYYFYCCHPSDIKFRSAYEELWGND